MKNKQTILILGASGFVGKNIVEKLSRKYNLLTPSHSSLDLLDGKKVEHYFMLHKVNVVIYAVNVGGKRNTKNVGIFIPNIQMFFNVVRCEEYFDKLIFIGSGAEYDKRKPLKNVSESSFGQSIPIDEYGFYKYLCSLYILQSKKCISLRAFGLFGKYEDYRVRFISQSILRELRNLQVVINKNVYFDYLYIDDFISIIEYVITHAMKYSIYNVGGKRYSLVQLAQKIQKVLGRKKKIILKQKGVGNEYTADSTRLFKEVKNFYPTPIEDALKELIKFYREDKFNN